RAVPCAGAPRGSGRGGGAPAPRRGGNGQAHAVPACYRALHGAGAGSRRRSPGGRRRGDRGAQRAEDRPQRALPLRFRQEVQALPRTGPVATVQGSASAATGSSARGVYPYTATPVTASFNLI